MVFHWAVRSVCLFLGVWTTTAAAVTVMRAEPFPKTLGLVLFAAFMFCIAPPSLSKIKQ